MSRTRSFASLSLVLCWSCGGAEGDGALLGQETAEATAASPLLNGSFEDDGTGVASPLGWVSSGSVNTDFTEWGGHTG